MSKSTYPPTPMIGMHRSRLGSSYIDQLCCTLLQIKTLWWWFFTGTWLGPRLFLQCSCCWLTQASKYCVQPSLNSFLWCYAHCQWHCYCSPVLPWPAYWLCYVFVQQFFWLLPSHGLCTYWKSSRCPIVYIHQEECVISMRRAVGINLYEFYYMSIFVYLFIN